MGKALYRKHRPKKLDDIIGQEHITTTLAKAIKSGRISHAYLLTGPRGTGKTSIARILAHEVNNLPYDDESIHLDIIEIDAASNRRIDEIRELKDRVNIAPTSAKYKVYIIDEVHMLTREAFNALLKTLEEPPEHAIFVLATTEAHKLPETIISRTQRFGLKPINLDRVTQQLKHIAEQEQIAIDDDALELVAQHGNGSFRDSISLLDQVGNSSDHITRIDVQQALGQAPEELLSNIVHAVTNNDTAALTQALKQATEQGTQPAQLAEQLCTNLRNAMLAEGFGATSTRLMELMSGLLDVPYARNPQVSLELVLYGAAMPVSIQAAQPAPVANPAPASAQTKSPKITPKPKPVEEPELEPEPEPPKPKPSPAVRIETDPSDSTDAPTEGDWKDILEAVKSKHNTLYGIARMATPQFSPGRITLVFGFPFHHKRVSDARNNEILSAIAKEVTGQPVVLAYTLDKTSKQPTVEQSKPKPTVDLSPITEIFGDAELLDQ